MIKNTALTDTHIDLGAKMVPFAGFNMPVQYSGINDEHETVRTGVGVFDVSHMGEFILKGKKRWTLFRLFLRMMLPNYMMVKYNMAIFQMKRVA